MASEEIQVDYPDTLESFNKEVERYKPRDMIDFCTEYFTCLTKGVPLRYKELSGLRKFHLTPEDAEVVRRLNIPDEDLVRVLNRRKIVTKEQILEKLNSEFDKYSQLIESNGQLTDEEMHNYLKLKTNTFRDYEFMRFLKDIEKLPISKNNYRIFFTKLYDLSEEEKKVIFKFCDLDYKIIKDRKIQSWKEMLILLNECNKHTYASYDNESQKIENAIKSFEEKKEQIFLEEFVVIFEKYQNIIDTMKKFEDEKSLYNFILGQYHYKRVIFYDILKLKVLGESKDKNEISSLFETYENIFNKNFAYLTELDYYDFILSCFIPLIKESDKTSLEHREMESYLNHLVLKIPKIYNINFEEEKNLYYNIECVKYFLNKKNNINTQQFKKIFIQIIQLFTKKVLDIKDELKITSHSDLLKLFKDKYELINLQYKEFYPHLVEFTEKMIKIAIKYDLDGSNKEIENSLISQFKSYEKYDQIIITNSMKMIELFESDKIKQKGINDTIVALVKAMSIPEMAYEIREHEERDREIIPTIVDEYYKNIIKQSRFDFNNLKYLTFKTQVQIVNLIIRNNKNLQNTAIIYQNNNITPYIDYDYMIEELFNFDDFYFKLYFDKSMKEQIDKDFENLLIKMQQKFPKIVEYVSSLDPEKSDTDTEYIEKFKTMNKFEQKLVLTYIIFLGNLKLERTRNDFTQNLSVIYLKDNIEFIKKQFIDNNNNTGQQAKLNQLYIENLYMELKHVNPYIYIYVVYDRGEDLLVRYSSEEKEYIDCIEQALGYKKTRVQKNCLSFKEMLSMEDNDKLLEDLKNYHPTVYDFITEFKENDNNDLADFRIFNDEERLIILKILKHQGKNVQNLNEYNDTIDDKLARVFRHTLLSEVDHTLDNPEISYIRYFFRKKLLCFEKYMTTSMKECVSLVLDYTFDPNNTYLKQDFLHFSIPEQLILLQDILCREKILDYNTMYYEQNLCSFMELYTKIFIDVLSHRNDNENFHKRIEDEFNYLLKFTNEKVGIFIKEINEVDNQSVFHYLNDFSLEERKIICYFLELYAALTKKEKYNDCKKGLEIYCEDLPYNERLKIINTQLDMIISNEALKSDFFKIAQDIKETAYEIDFLIESICQSDENTNEAEPYLLFLFETFSKELREITIKTLKCIREQNNNKVLELYISVFDNKKEDKEKNSIFVSIKEAFEKIDKNLVPNHDNSDKKENYDKLKETLNPLCGDLFKFVDDCKVGRFNLRKINAISKEKLEITKLIMNCENLIQPNKKLKDASHTLSLIKIQ